MPTLTCPNGWITVRSNLIYLPILSFVTNDSSNAKDLRNFPIPRQHKFSDKFSKVDIVKRLMENFEEQQKQLDRFRRLYKHYSHETLVEDRYQTVVNAVV